ncbi:hypothetical protein FB45DRAFT_357852 [Roridomyces roridus]|uniref:Uncharacterized protein n=1 Tax=Roridomyces roridus TaxID=1738132 RepID=A0AAD7FWM0_9AGAR|nr:hypothetical protein FB45DRAFT_357852 [Roridomyces roridus]
MAARRGRPPNLTLQAPARPANVDLELESPQPLELEDDEGLDLAGDLSSPDPLSDDETDIARSLARLEQLRQNVQQNLRLRPIRSSGSLKVKLGDTSPWEPSSSSPASSISSYFTPAGEAPLSARFIGTTPPAPSTPRKSQPIEPGTLYDRICAPRRPLLIDTRPPAAHVAFHIRHSSRSSLDLTSAAPNLALNLNAQPPRSPLPVMSSVISSSSSANPINIVDATPSPPPSQVGFRRPPPPMRRPSAPNLRKLDTKSAERLKLQVRTMPLKANTIALAPPSPSHAGSSPSTPWTLSSPLSGTDEFPTAYFTPPHTPRVGANGFSFARGFGDPPPTARPDDPPTTEEPFPEFTISTILPNFLFLGPELTTPEHTKGR